MACLLWLREEPTFLSSSSYWSSSKGTEDGLTGDRLVADGLSLICSSEWLVRSDVGTFFAGGRMTNLEHKNYKSLDISTCLCHLPAVKR